MANKKRKKPYIVRLMRKIKKTFRMWKRKNPLKAYRLHIITTVCIIAIVAFATFKTGLAHDFVRHFSESEEASVTEAPADTMTPQPTEEVVQTAAPVPVQTKVPSKKNTVDTRYLYSYFQGPKAWKKKLAWSGYWGDAYIGGRKFGAYGCGLCCMANVYSSITSETYKASPVDMRNFVKKKTGYWGVGAIDRKYMVVGMRKAGIYCGPKRKPKRYSSFRRDIAKSKCAVVLVSSYDSTCFWKGTPGHYVTIFAYDKKRDRVFLADSGDPKHNRRWISLKKVYRSLKKASRYQYVCVTGYNNKKDAFKNRKARGKWIKPAYMR